MLIFCAATAKAQEADTAKIIEHFPNGDLIITVSGKEFRALPADSWRRVLADRIQIDSSTKEMDIKNQKIEQLEKQIAYLESLVAKFEDIANNVLAQSELNRQNWQETRDLLDRSITLMKRGKIAGFFDKPVMVILKNLLVPGLTLYFTARK